MEWEGSDVWFAHCCMLDDQETQQFADKGIGIAHCPSSNLRLASGEPRHLALDLPTDQSDHCCIVARSIMTAWIHWIVLASSWAYH